MANAQKVVSTYSAVAAEYYDSSHKTCRNFDLATDRALKAHVPVIDGGGLVLEVGCGRGRSAEYLHVDPSHIIQLDSCKEMLNLQPRESCLVRLHADATSVPMCDEQFETVAGFLVDAFIGLCFFAEAYRLLKPRGLLVATTPAIEWGHALRGADVAASGTAQFVTKDKQRVDVPSTLVTRSKLQEMLEHCGFIQIAIWPQNLPADAMDISPDIVTAATRARVGVHDLPLVYLFSAVKP